MAGARTERMSRPLRSPRAPIPYWSEVLARWGVVFGVLSGVVLGIAAFVSYDRWRDGRQDRPAGAIAIGWVGLVVVGLFLLTVVSGRLSN